MWVVILRVSSQASIPDASERRAIGFSDGGQPRRDGLQVLLDLFSCRMTGKVEAGVIDRDDGGECVGHFAYVDGVNAQAALLKQCRLLSNNLPLGISGLQGQRVGAPSRARDRLRLR